MSTTAQNYFGNGPNASNTDNMYHDDSSLISRLDLIMWSYILPVLIGIGTIGNVLSIIVIKKSKLGNTSIGFYMFVYAIIGLLCLYRYGVDWLCSIMEWQEPKDISEWGCRFLQFIYRVITYSGIWILVSALVDRYISVCHYRSAQAMCQLFMAKVAVSIVMIGVIVVSVHAMWSYSLLQVYIGRKVCYPMTEDLYIKVWQWVSACCYSFIPLFALFVLSLLLVCGMCDRQRGATIPVQDDVPVDLTCTILVLSILFLVAALPATIINIIDFTMPNQAIDYDQLSIARTVTNFIQCANNVFLFFVLSLSSSSFRQEMKQTFAGIVTKIRQRNILNDLKHSNSRNSDRLAIEIHSNDTLL